jgi:WD40 repeat protein
VSGDGEKAALLTDSGIRVVDLATGATLFRVPWDDHTFWTWDMAWSPDGSHLALAFATVDPARSLLVVDETGRRVAWLPELAGHSTRSVSFSADGRQLATTRWGVDTVDPTKMPVRIWDLETQTVARRIDTAAELTEFAPAGGLIASSRPVDGIAEIWDAGTGVRIATLTATAHIAALAFDASGSRLATAHADGTVRLWDPRTGSQNLVLHVGDQAVEHVWFTPDGSMLVTADDAGSVRVWALDVEALIGLAHDELTRELSEDECRQYLRVARCSDA